MEKTAAEYLEEDLNDWIVIHGEDVAIEVGIERQPDGQYTPEDLDRLFDECRKRFMVGYPQENA